MRDEELEAIRHAVHTPWENSGAKVRIPAESVMELVMEIDRLRSGLLLAKEWLENACTETMYDLECKHCAGRNGFREWLRKDAGIA